MLPRLTQPPPPAWLAGLALAFVVLVTALVIARSILKTNARIH